MKKFTVCVLITCTIAISLGFDCSNVVEKESQGLLNYLGRINWTAPVNTGDSGWAIKMGFDQVFTGVGVWDGYVSSNGTAMRAEIVNREGDEYIDAGEQRSMQFRVYYGMDVPEPQIVSLQFQEIELCNQN